MLETTTIGVPRRALSFAAAAALALSGTVALAAGSSQAAPKEHKVWVCKYVDIPGKAERLKDGKQPIEVDWHSLTGKSGPPKVGDTFSDRHEKSVVVQIGGESPGRTACEPKKPPTTPPKTTPPKTTPPKITPPKKAPPARGGGVPGVGAPDTGGAGDSSPVSGLIGSGLLLAAGGILARDAVLRRRAKSASN
jgi:hypothetical protein